MPLAPKAAAPENNLTRIEVVGAILHRPFSLKPRPQQMPFLDLLSPDRVHTNFKATGKGDLLQRLSVLLAADTSESGLILDALGAREALGSTGLGRGVAIPHGRIEGLSKARAAFVRLASPLEFDAIDGQPVDLVAALAVPAQFNDQHLKLLGELAEIFSDAEMTNALREAADGSVLHAKLAEFAGTRLRDSAWTD